jgi:hypothetical protein
MRTMSDEEPVMTNTSAAVEIGRKIRLIVQSARSATFCSVHAKS